MTIVIIIKRVVGINRRQMYAVMPRLCTRSASHVAPVANENVKQRSSLLRIAEKCMA